MRVGDLQLRPLPVLVILLFAAVAIGDLVKTLREEDPVPPEMLRPGAVRFEASEPVIDLRASAPVPEIEMLPIPKLAGPLWSTPDATGVWALGDGAEIRLDLVNGGHRFLILEARPAAGKRPVRSVRITVNGIDCGSIALSPGWHHLELEIPQGAVRNGANIFRLGVPDRSMVRRPRRAVHLRRLGLLRTPSPARLVRGAPDVAADFASQSAVVRAPGELQVPFSVDDRIDALRMEYRFGAPGCSGEVVVERPEGGGFGRDAPVRRNLGANSGGVGRIRIPLHGRRGEFVLRVRLAGCAAQEKFRIRALKLVREGIRPKSHPR